MPTYRAPLREMKFLTNELLDYPAHYASLPNGAEATPDVVDSILAECARFCENVLAPLNAKGDQAGCRFEDGKVFTPPGVKEAYVQFAEGGWQGLSHPAEYGGQGFPTSLGLLKSEMVASSNLAFVMYSALGIGAMNTILAHGTEEQKRAYVPKLADGTWAATMCLTEPQCGTDLGQVSTKAVPRADGTYLITGSKIFISGGEHDLTENILHVVLARLPDAPAGTRGISLFLVPKFLASEGGALGEFNRVACSAIEHKMGIKASPTCSIEFEGSIGYLIGPVNKGLECMFSFMNTMRLGSGMQGVSLGEVAYQGALAYSKERRSMRALTGKKEPEQVADALHHHADVRRMLLTMKAITEGGRAMVYECAQYADRMIAAMEAGDAKTQAYWDDKLGFLTPIVKGFLTEVGCEATNLGMQVFGGHGYIREHGMEQTVRDMRIATLYEGTTGIQALDLLGRKVLLVSKGKAVQEYTAEILKFCAKHASDRRMRPFVWQLGKHVAEWNYLTLRVALAAKKDRDTVGSASVDFLMYAGYVALAYYWARMAAVGFAKLEAGDGAEPREFYEAKIATAEFYFQRLLPRAKAHAESMLASSASVMQLPIEAFAFV